MRGHVDGRGRQQTHVGDQPFKPILAQQADTVPRLDARVHQRRAASQGVLTIALPANIVEHSEAPVAQGRAQAEAFSLTAMQLGKVSVAHGNPFPREVQSICSRRSLGALKALSTPAAKTQCPGSGMGIARNGTAVTLATSPL